jgi:hypothetical protein
VTGGLGEEGTGLIGRDTLKTCAQGTRKGSLRQRAMGTGRQRRPGRCCLFLLVDLVFDGFKLHFPGLERAVETVSCLPAPDVRRDSVVQWRETLGKLHGLSEPSSRVCKRVS